MQTWQAGGPQDGDGTWSHITISSKLSAEGEKSDRGNHTISSTMSNSDRRQRHHITRKSWAQGTASWGTALLGGHPQSSADHCRVSGALCVEAQTAHDSHPSDKPHMWGIFVSDLGPLFRSQYTRKSYTYIIRYNLILFHFLRTENMYYLSFYGFLLISTVKGDYKSL